MTFTGRGRADKHAQHIKRVVAAVQCSSRLSGGRNAVGLTGARNPGLVTAKDEADQPIDLP